MLKPLCPICNGAVVSRCSCIKAISICENDHKFHYSIKLLKINLYAVEAHFGLGDHFTDTCKDCKIIK
jgi:hypothetical protein